MTARHEDQAYRGAAPRAVARASQTDHCVTNRRFSSLGASRALPGALKHRIQHLLVGHADRCVALYGLPVAILLVQHRG